MSNNTRKLTYKLPPTTITDTFISQESRRIKALQEQKQRRALRFDSARQLDQFVDLSLDQDEDDEEEDADINSHGKLDGKDGEARDISIGTPDDERRAVKKKKKRRPRKSKSKWADRCMYAELLEISPDEENHDNGLPADLESAWVAVGPVPCGKRCMAITQASGSAPNTTIRSRLLGKVLLRKFPSILPPLTVLDCILDANWTQNGILHVLDVIRWKGHDLAHCETSLRFWWRDTRLAELSQAPLSISSSPSSLQEHQHKNTPSQYRFTYPNTFIPVPHHANMTYRSLLNHVLPAVRAPRYVTIDLPLASSTVHTHEETMEVDVWTDVTRGKTAKLASRIDSDGLLLYVKEASYESGTSPLSCWVPLHPTSGEENVKVEEGSPLDLFEVLVGKRAEMREDQGMEVESSV